MMNSRQLRGVRLWGLTIYLISLISPISSSVILPECTRDVDCGSGYYCLQSYCERCIPCEGIFNRYPPLSPSGEPICAKEEDDCGACLPGYVADDLVAQRRSMKCLKESTDSPSSSYPWIGLAFVVGFILTLVAIMLLACCCWRPNAENKTADVEEHLIMRPARPTAPPAYQEQDPNASNETFPLIDALGINEGNVIQLVDEYNNQAVPVYNLGRAADNSQNFEFNVEQIVEEDQEEHVDVGNDGAAILDEDTNDSTATNPSNWAPTPAQSNMSIASLHRSQSQEMPPCPLHRLVVRVNSDPTLPERRRTLNGGESYSHLHVRLSNYRSDSDHSTVNSSSGAYSAPDEARKLDGRLSDSTLNGSCSGSETQESLLISNEITERIRRDHQSLEERSFPSNHLTLQEFRQGSQDSGFQDQKRRIEDDQSSESLKPDPKRHCNHCLEKE